MNRPCENRKTLKNSQKEILDKEGLKSETIDFLPLTKIPKFE